MGVREQQGERRKVGTLHELAHSPGLLTSPLPPFPLRCRYGDLLAHWQLKAALRGEAPPQSADQLGDEMEAVATTMQVLLHPPCRMRQQLQRAPCRAQRACCMSVLRRGPVPAETAAALALPVAAPAFPACPALACQPRLPLCLLTFTALAPRHVQRLTKLEREVESYWVAEYFRQATA